MKHRLLLLSVFTLLLCLPSQAAQSFTDGGLNYTIVTGGYATVAAYTTGSPYTGEYTIPATVNYDGVEYPVQTIANYAFQNCTGVTKITIEGNNMQELGQYSFDGCSNLASINIPESVTVIQMYCFRNCSTLNGVELPEGLTTLGQYAFGYCSSLTAINVPDGITSVPTYCFSNSGLTKVELGAGIESIGTYAFYNCTALQDVNIPENVTIIDGRAFYGCSALETNINLKNVTTIGDYAFYNCKLVPSVTIPDTTTSIGQQAFYGCEAMTELTIGEGLTSIGLRAFQNCKSLTEVTLPDALTEINDYAFYTCSSLSQLTLGNYVETIGERAFSDCALTEVTLPATVTSVGRYAFYRMPDITSFTSLNTAPPTCGEDGICNTAIYSNCPLYVPLDSKSDYEKADIWEKFTHIVGLNDDGSIYYSVTTGAVEEDDVTYNTAKLTATIDGYIDGVTTKGFYYYAEGKSSEPQIYVVTTDEFSCTIEGLQPNTTYYYNAFIKTFDGYEYQGEQLSFTTAAVVHHGSHHRSYGDHHRRYGHHE